MGKFILITLVGLAMFAVAAGLGFAAGATMIEPENSCSVQAPSDASRG